MEGRSPALIPPESRGAPGHVNPARRFWGCAWGTGIAIAIEKLGIFPMSPAT